MPETATAAPPLWHRATSPDDALRLMAEMPDAVIAAGMTALQLDWPAHLRGSRADGPVIDISGLAMGPDVSVLPDGWLRIAANAPLERLRRDPLTGTFPALRTLLTGIAASGVRALATLGGNLMWGAGDAATFCSAFETRIVTTGGQHPYRPGTANAGLLLAVETRPVDGFVEKVGFRAGFTPARILLAGARNSDGLQLAARVRGGVIARALVNGATEPISLGDRLCADTGLEPGSEDAAILRALVAGRTKDYFA